MTCGPVGPTQDEEERRGGERHFGYVYVQRHPCPRRFGGESQIVLILGLVAKNELLILFNFYFLPWRGPPVIHLEMLFLAA